MTHDTWKKAWNPLRYFSGWVPTSEAKKLTIDFDSIKYPVVLFGGGFRLVLDREGYESFMTIPVHPAEWFEKYLEKRS